MTTCAVCGVEVEHRTASPDSSYGSEDYPPAETDCQGETYLFCSSEHTQRFQDTPEQFRITDSSETDE